MYEFNFTSVLGTLWGSVDGLQLGGLALFDYDNNLLSIASITNPGGSNTANQGPSNLIDYQPSDRQSVEAALAASGGNKWYDGNFASQGWSTLRITLAQPGAVAGYMLATAPDVRRRDPVSWTLRVLGAAASYEIDRRDLDQAAIPVARDALYPLVNVVAPPPFSPPAPPVVPPSPPALPPMGPSCPMGLS